MSRRLINVHYISPTYTSSLSNNATSSRKRTRSSLANFTRADTLRRMEEDRERHKRLREKMWVLPIPVAGRMASSEIGYGQMPNGVAGSVVGGGAEVGTAGGVVKLLAAEGTTGAAGMSMPSPVGSMLSPASSSVQPSPASPSDRYPAPMASSSSSVTAEQGEGKTGVEDGVEIEYEHPLDVEWEQIWENTSELDEDDLQRMKQLVLSAKRY